MSAIRQLLRQPMKTLCGVILITLAVAVLCVCLGQTMAAVNTQRRLDETFQTAAFPSLTYSKEADDWALSYAAQNPEVVTSSGVRGLASAYIPELVPDNYTDHIKTTRFYNNNFTLQPDVNGAQYNSAMLVVTLTQIGIPSNRFLGEDGFQESESVWFQAEGIIEEVVGLQEGYGDPTGFTAQMTVYLPDMKAFEDADLEIGGRYLVYCTDYFDLDWIARSTLSERWGIEFFEAFEPDNLQVLPGMEDDPENSNKVVAAYSWNNNRLGIPRNQYDNVRSVRFTVIEESVMPDMGYAPGYGEPTIIRLEGSVQEFLSTEDGTLWREALGNITVNSHAFPVIGVEDMDNIADFLRGMARIVEGRSFTAEEMESGAKVCILSKSLVEANGLTVGDVIYPQFYENDSKVPYQINVTEGEGSVNPVAAYYYSGTMTLREPEAYTIIGLYQQDLEWGNVDDNLYSFTPNTIFAPISAVEAVMEVGYNAFFRTFELKNSAAEIFISDAAKAGFDGQFYYYDNGYSTVARSMAHYYEMAVQALIVGLCVYGIILVLYLLLYPLQQSQVLAAMESLGADRGERILHVLVSSIGILLPGTLLGALTGLLGWRKVMEILTADAAMNITVEMDIESMLLAAGVQLVLVLAAALFAGQQMTRGRSLMVRR